MAYIGRDIDKISNVEVLDNITFDGSSSYTLQKGGSNFTPSSANTLLVSIDGVVQAGNFTVSGSTINFGTAVSASSTCNFILHYGVGLITAPADGTVTTAKLADSSVSLAKLTATGTKDATTFLRGDNTFASAGGTNTPAFFARLSASQNVTNNASVKAQCNTEILDTDNCYDNVTNYRFTPTTAGKYFVFGQIGFNTGLNNSVQLAIVGIKKNGTTVQYNQFDFRTNYAGQQNMVMTHGIVDMDGTTDYLELFGEIYVVAGSTYQFGGSASNNSTSFGAYKIIE